MAKGTRFFESNVPKIIGRDVCKTVNRIYFYDSVMIRINKERSKSYYEYIFFYIKRNGKLHLTEFDGTIGNHDKIFCMEIFCLKGIELDYFPLIQCRLISKGKQTCSISNTY